ncbi:hypothetical protein CXR04_07155 [Streptomyces sp. CMB-StM0423]|nr:hypothetical protein CXR04_07155 [Streptomyces sp. CMB-StM0423]
MWVVEVALSALLTLHSRASPAAAPWTFIVVLVLAALVLRVRSRPWKWVRLRMWTVSLHT